MDLNRLSAIRALTQQYKGKMYADRFERMLKDLVQDIESKIKITFDDDTQGEIIEV